jgi:hypothetical protein
MCRATRNYASRTLQIQYVISHTSHALQPSRLPTPGSRLPAPDSRLPAPGSRLPAPGSRLPAPDSRLPAPDSRLPTPGSRLPTPGSRLPTPGSRLPAPDSLPRVTDAAKNPSPLTSTSVSGSIESRSYLGGAEGPQNLLYGAIWNPAPFINTRQQPRAPRLRLKWSWSPHP